MLWVGFQEAWDVCSRVVGSVSGGELEKAFAMSKNTMKVHFSSASNEWATPRELYERLNTHLRFTLDPCCTIGTAKCSQYFTKEDDGLSQSWGHHRVFMNPPYGRAIGKWVKKAYEESMIDAELVACLIPSRTDTKWWHQYCMKAAKIILFEGRIKFERDDGLKAPAPFPSCLVIFSWKKSVASGPNFVTMRAHE